MAVIGIWSLDCLFGGLIAAGGPAALIKGFFHIIGGIKDMPKFDGRYAGCNLANEGPIPSLGSKIWGCSRMAYAAVLGTV